MEFKEVVIADASTEAKVAALALLVDKRLSELANVVLTTKKLQGPQGEQGIQGPKGEQGDRGLDGQAGKDGKDGVDGKDGKDGKEGVGVSNAYIDFDGSLVIELTDGRQINAGEVVAEGAADKIRLVKSGGGNSQPVLDDIAALQAAVDAIETTIASYGTMATQNANNVAITGGSINGTTIGGTTPAAGTFTTLSTGTLTATGQTSLGGAAGGESLRAVTQSGQNICVEVKGGIYGTNSAQIVTRPSGAGSGFNIGNGNAGPVSFHTNDITGTSLQARVAHTASAVNYVQVTGAATGGRPTISAQGSDASVGLNIFGKSGGSMIFSCNGTVTALQLNNTTSGVNYLQMAGAVAGAGPVLSSAGSDTNISQVFQSKGTGAIDLAAGSRGVNISNGGTVTAITRTANGSGYTSIPTIAITAPTTAGGVQATATASLFANTATVSAGGTGYTLNDVVTLVGGTPAGSGATYTVTGVSGGVVTSVSPLNFQSYTTLPSNPVSVTGGTGTGLTLTVTYGYQGATITNAGSGYVEQPTVTFSGGGGSGAAAYASVGSNVTVKGLAGNMFFATSGGTNFQVSDSGQNSPAAIPFATGGSTSAGFGVTGSATNAGFTFTSKGTGNADFYTNTYGSLGLRVSHTASAVNYVQVTGAATGSSPVISSQGSDTNLGLQLRAKGTGAINLMTQGGLNQAVVFSNGDGTNFLGLRGGNTGIAPRISAEGSDTNIDLTLTPKGTGLVRFGTYTAGAPAATGYISIKAADGTTYKVLVGT